jgi:hypothetical protein
MVCSTLRLRPLNVLWELYNAEYMGQPRIGQCPNVLVHHSYLLWVSTY